MSLLNNWSATKPSFDEILVMQSSYPHSPFHVSLHFESEAA